MSSHFDTNAEDAKLQMIREDEEEDLARILSGKYNLTYTDLSIVPVNVDALRVIPEKDARAGEVVAFDKAGKHLSLALRNPQNETLPSILTRLTDDGYILQQYLISQKSLDRALEHYADLSYAAGSKAGVFDISGEELTELTSKLSSLPALRAFFAAALEGGKTTQVSQVFEGLLAGAFAMKASDIHIEPEEQGVRVRLRLDGILTDTYMLDEHAYKLIASRIKLLSGLKLNVKDRAQDGRFSVVMNGTEVEIRTSVIPGNYGESIVLRVLDPSAIQHSLESMGIEPKLLARLKTEIRRPNGMLLTTGPTGSGKTTTLYAFLSELYSPDIKIVTLEDPIEYHLQGIVQTQVKGGEYTFASGLRSILRQDPDVIMVGEIRDADVAETAIQASLTGHFVFSTLHTNDAAGTFPRLVDLGADPKTFASAVTVAMAQRLVRTLDPETRTKRKATDDEKRLMEKVFWSLEDKSLMPANLNEVWDAAPRNTDETGYKGRTGVFEAIFMDDDLGEFLRDNPSSGDIEKATRRQGFLTMAQDGVIKALNGITTLEEVVRTIDIERT